MGFSIKSFGEFVHRNHTALLVLLGTLFLTFISWQLAIRQEEANYKVSFIEKSASANQDLEQRIRSDLQQMGVLATLLGGLPAKGQIDTFLRQPALIQQYPGLTAIGFVPAAVISGGLAGNTQLTPSAGNFLQVISNGISLYPVPPPDKERFAAELVLGGPQITALNQARDTGQPAAGPAFNFATATDRDHVIPVYLPVYRSGLPHRQFAERQRAFQGVLVGFFDIQRLLSAVLGEDFQDRTNVEVYAGYRPDPANLLFNTEATRQATIMSRAPSFRKVGRIDLANTPLLVYYFYKPTLFPLVSSRIPNLMLFTGLLMSLLITVVSWQAHARQRQAQAQIEREQKFRSLYDQNPDAVSSHDLAGRYLEANAAAARMAGLPPEQLPGQPLVRFIPITQQEMVQSHFNQAIQGEAQNFEATFVTPSGGFFIASISFIPIVLEEAITGIFTIAKDITDRKQKEDQLFHLSSYDPLTGLPNRTLMLDRLNQGITRARTSRTLASLMFVDLDRFKEINESMGHTVGDILIKEAAGRIRDCLREEDTLGRFSGDTFMVLIEGNMEREPINIAAEQIQQSLAVPFNLEGKDIFLSASIGIAIYPWDADQADDLMKAADTALYYAKKHKGNTCRAYQKVMTEQVAEQITIKNQLKRAIERNEFVLYYQPQVNVKNHQITGAEALIRWQHPELGLQSPGYFIPVAEESGLIDQIGDWVLHHVCGQIKEWLNQGIALPLIAVNVSANQFQKPDFVAEIQSLLKTVGIPARNIELEITEGLLMEDIGRSIQTLSLLKDLGISISVDDFGTGYSSLSYLANFPLDVLKIDRSFIVNVATNPHDAVVTATILSLAQSLKMKVVAEGVETHAQNDFLLPHDGVSIQGFLYSKPLPAEHFIDVVQQGYLAAKG